MAPRPSKPGWPGRVSSLKQRHHTPGSLPGSLVAPADSPPPRYSLIQFGPDHLNEITDAALSQVMDWRGQQPITWLNVEGLGDVEAIRHLGQSFGLHALALEDVLSSNQRPKFETYNELLFIVARMPHPEAPAVMEQVSFFLGKDFLLTFQSGVPGDCFEIVRRQLHDPSSRVRQGTPAFLLYALLDTLVDHFFPQLEFYSELIEQIEDRIVVQRHSGVGPELYAIRRQLLLMHRVIRPLQDVIAGLMSEPMHHFDDETRWYLRDMHDHTQQLRDLIDTYTSLASHLMDMAAQAGHIRMNEIMRFLTMVSSVFMPLTFIAGVYGMNFKTDLSPYNMPELSWAYGYPLSLGFMLTVAFGLVLFFRNKGWLGVPASERRLSSLQNRPIGLQKLKADGKL